MRQFEIGKKYAMRSVCDYDCIWSYEVINRTASTIQVRDLDTNKVSTLRISKKVSEYFGEETVYPLGKYSMCPILTANKIIA